MHTGQLDSFNSNAEGHSHLHGLPQNAAYEGLPPLQAPLRLKDIKEVSVTYAAVGGCCLCSLLCPCCTCFAAITPED